MTILLAMMTAFAWAIGGEKYFGKWRRGMLVAIPFAIKGALSGVAWWYYPALAVLAWATYQALFYDERIKMIWPDPNVAPRTTWQKVLGWLGLFTNGALASAIPCFYWACVKNFLRIPMALMVCGLGFMFICWLSNEKKFKFNSYCVVYDGVKLWCPEDCWWLACWIFGWIVGLS